MSASDASRKARLRSISAWISVWSSVLPLAASAQADQCRVPAELSIADARRPTNEEPRIVPVVGYTLALSWSPQFCRARPDDGQCDRANGTFGFILHGLWPEGAGRNYPQWCAAAPAPITPQMARDQFCAQPSTKLMVHEWAKHGSCVTQSPADYLAASRKLFAAVRIPDMTALSRRTIDVGTLKRAISAANASIMPSAIVVTTERNGGWLREVRLCLARDMRPEPCPRGRSGGAPDGAPLKIWRATL